MGGEGAGGVILIFLGSVKFNHVSRILILRATYSNVQLTEIISG